MCLLSIITPIFITENHCQCPFQIDKSPRKSHTVAVSEKIINCRKTVTDRKSTVVTRLVPYFHGEAVNGSLCKCFYIFTASP